MRSIHRFLLNFKNLFPEVWPQNVTVPCPSFINNMRLLIKDLGRAQAQEFIDHAEYLSLSLDTTPNANAEEGTYSHIRINRSMMNFYTLLRYNKGHYKNKFCQFLGEKIFPCYSTLL